MRSHQSYRHKHQKRLTRQILLGLFLLSSVCSLWRMMPTEPCVRSDDVELTYDAVLSNSAQQMVRASFSALCVSGQTVSNLSAAVCRECSYIDALSCRRMALGKSFVHCISKKLAYAINDDYVLSSDGALYAADLFEHHARDALTQIRVAPHLLTSSQIDLARMLARYDQNLFARFTLVYRDFYNVLLQRKNDLCNYFVVADEQALERVPDVDHVVRALEASSGKPIHQAAWVLDVRYENRIYARQASKGRGT